MVTIPTIYITQEEYLAKLKLDDLLRLRYNSDVFFWWKKNIELFGYKCRVVIEDAKLRYFAYGKYEGYHEITNPEHFRYADSTGYRLDKKLIYAELKLRPHKIRWYEKKKGGNFAIYKLNKHEIKQSLIPKMRNYKLEKLQNGETFTTSEKGNSMNPLIKSGQEHIIEPSTWESCEINDIVYCKVKGRYYTHLVKAKDLTLGCLIGSNQGSINGWTKHVYGKVIEIL